MGSKTSSVLFIPMPLWRMVCALFQFDSAYSLVSKFDELMWERERQRVSTYFEVFDERLGATEEEEGFCCNVSDENERDSVDICVCLTFSLLISSQQSSCLICLLLYISFFFFFFHLENYLLFLVIFLNIGTKNLKINLF